MTRKVPTLPLLLACLVVFVLAIFRLPPFIAPSDGDSRHPHLPLEMLSDPVLYSFKANVGGYLLFFASAALGVAAILVRTAWHAWALPAPVHAAMVVLAQNSWPGWLRLVVALPMPWLVREIWRTLPPGAGIADPTAAVRGNSEAIVESVHRAARHQGKLQPKSYSSLESITGIRRRASRWPSRRGLPLDGRDR